MRTKRISVSEYASKVNTAEFRQNRKYPDRPITEQAVKYRIKKGIPLPDVISYERIGKVHVLTVRDNF